MAEQDFMELEKYFSEWFDFISREEAEEMWNKDEKNFLVLREDGSDAYADCYDSFEEIEIAACLFGVERD